MINKRAKSNRTFIYSEKYITENWTSLTQILFNGRWRRKWPQML